MAIRINPGDTLEKPSLSLITENSYYRVSFSSIPQVEETKYKTTLDVSGMKSEQDKAGLYNETTGFPSVSAGGGVFISTDKKNLYGTKGSGNVMVAEDFVNNPIVITNTVWDASGNSNPLNVDNTSFTKSFSNVRYLGVQTVNVIGNDNKQYTLYYNCIYADLTITITITDMEVVAKMFNNSAVLKANRKHASLFTSTTVPATINRNIITEDSTDYKFAVAKLGVSMQTDYVAKKNIVVNDSDAVITLTFSNIMVSLESSYFGDIKGAFDYYSTMEAFLSFADSFTISFLFSNYYEQGDAKQIDYTKAELATEGYSYDFQENSFLSYNSLYGTMKLYEYLGYNIISRYKDGKQTATLTVKVKKYFNDGDDVLTAEPAVDPALANTFKYIKVGNIVIPYIYNSENAIVPLLSDSNGAVQFIVMASKLCFREGMLVVELSIMQK